MYPNEAVLYQAILVAAGLIGIIIGYFIISVIWQQRKHRLYHKHKIDAEIITLEKERKRIAEDIHDELGPILSAVNFKLCSLEGLPYKAESEIDICIKHTNDIIEKIRAIANHLMPNTLLSKGPLYALEEFIDTVAVGIGLDVQFNTFEIPELAHSRELHVYRILQEIVHNTIKHAKATVLKIDFYIRRNKLIILTSDDGIGFTYQENAIGSSGLGLHNLQSRVEVLSGIMYVRTKPGYGTKFHIELPLKL